MIQIGLHSSSETDAPTAHPQSSIHPSTVHPSVCLFALSYLSLYLSHLTCEKRAGVVFDPVDDGAG